MQIWNLVNFVPFDCHSFCQLCLFENNGFSEEGHICWMVPTFYVSHVLLNKNVFYQQWYFYKTPNTLQKAFQVFRTYKLDAMRQNWRFIFMSTRHAPFKQDEMTGDLSASDSIVVSWIWRILMVEDLQQIHGKRKSQRTISKQTWVTFNPYQHRKIKQQRGKIAWSLPNFFLGIWKKPKKEDVWSIRHFLKNSEVCQNDQIITTFRILFFVVFLMMNNN